MKRIRYLFLILLSAFFLNAEAGDTLTRAQVYNYNVGDTFDYRISDWSYGPIPYSFNYGYTIQISYSRYIISNIYWSVDTLTKYIVRSQVYPYGNGFDTIVLNNLQGYEVILDSIANNSSNPDIYTTSGLSTFFGREMNSITIAACCSPGLVITYYASGLGTAITNNSGGGDGLQWNDSITLIYYSGDSGTYGTPYTSFTTSIDNVSFNNKIKIYPSVNDGAFTIETGDETQLPLDLNIYDMEGRKSLELLISEKNSLIKADRLSNGLYIWKACNDGNILQTGKMVIER